MQVPGEEPSPGVSSGAKVGSREMASILSLSCRCNSRKNWGVAHQRPGFLSKRAGRSRAIGGATVTFCRAWHTRVVGRSSTGISYFSESSKALATKFLASWGQEGSSTGTLANMAKKRLSCSVWEL